MDEFDIQVVAAISGGILGAITGALASLLTEFLLTRRRKRHALGFSLEEEIDYFCGEVAAYWSIAGQNAVQESEIIRSYHRIRMKVDRYIDVSGCANVDPIKILLNDVHKLATGGNFAGVQRIADLNRIEETRIKLRWLLERLEVK